MSNFDRQAHWQAAYAAKDETEVSWFEEFPSVSFGLIQRSGASEDSAIIDVGGGASRLVDVLLDNGYRAITVLDLSDTALAAARKRLGSRSEQVHWVLADSTQWQPSREYDVWHDRAAFHFLTDPRDRHAYADRLTRGLAPGGQAIIGTFALDGPERCSGLPVVRYDSESLSRTLGEAFELEETLAHDHHTPWGGIQRFQFSRFRKLR